MSYGTATAMALGLTWGCLDNGDMILDRDSGEFVPADQVIHDPLHIDQLDFLNEDGFGHLKATLVYDDDNGDQNDLDDADEAFRLLFDTPLNDFSVRSERAMSHDPDESLVGQISRVVSVRGQSVSRHKRGRIETLD